MEIADCRPGFFQVRVLRLSCNIPYEWSPYTWPGALLVVYQQRSHDNGARPMPGLDEPVGKSVHDGGCDSKHNAQITWDHSLRQISEWDGTLWD